MAGVGGVKKGLTHSSSRPQPPYRASALSTALALYWGSLRSSVNSAPSRQESRPTLTQRSGARSGHWGSFRMFNQLLGMARDKAGAASARRRSIGASLWRPGGLTTQRHVRVVHILLVGERTHLRLLTRVLCHFWHAAAHAPIHVSAIHVTLRCATIIRHAHRPCRRCGRRRGVARMRILEAQR